jgi:hypothetical protein
MHGVDSADQYLAFYPSIKKKWSGLKSYFFASFSMKIVELISAVL